MKKDWLLFIDILLIVAVGLTTLYSTVIGTEGVFAGGGILNKQLIFVLVGFGLYFSLSYFDYRFLGYRQVILPMYAVSLLLLIFVLVFGCEINNAKRWIVIGDFQLQPSEIAKLAMLMTTAWLFSMRTKINVWILAGVSFILTLVMTLLVFREPDAGTSIILFAVWGLTVFSVIPNQGRNSVVLSIGGLGALLVNLLLGSAIQESLVIGMLLVAATLLGAALIKNTRILLVAALLGGLTLGFVGRVSWNYAWENVLSETQRDRVEDFINPTRDVTGSGFQVDQSKVAIGSGMLLGKGFGHGTQSKLNFLPEHQTDFIFASFAEEFGFVGVVFVLSLYGLTIIRIFSASAAVSDSFGSLLCLGLGIKLMLEVFINIGMNLGLIPATGVPLPLMSSGGTIFLITMISFGLVQSVRIHQENVGLVE